MGMSQQRLLLSVDTGSSDLWFASTDCSTSACSSSHATLYDASTSTQTGQSANLTYLYVPIHPPHNTAIYINDI